MQGGVNLNIESLLVRFVLNIIPILSAAYIIVGIYFLNNKWRNKLNNFSLFLFASALYTFGYFLEVNSSNLGTALIFRNFEYLGVVFVPTFLFLFILDLTKTEKIKKKIAIVLYTISATLWLLYLSNWHSLFYKSYSFSLGEYGGSFITEKGTAYYFLLFYYVVIIVFSNIILMQAYKKANNNKRKSYRFLLISLLAPWFSVIFILAGFDKYIDLAPLNIMILCGLFAINELRNDMFELKTNRWLKISESMKDAAFLINLEGEIVCANPIQILCLVILKNR